MSALKSVVGPKQVTAWKEGKLQSEDSPLALLYNRFWGVSMEQEEKEWRDSECLGDKNMGVGDDKKEGEEDADDDDEEEEAGKGDGKGKGEGEKPRTSSGAATPLTLVSMRLRAQSGSAPNTYGYSTISQSSTTKSLAR